MERKKVPRWKVRFALALAAESVEHVGEVNGEDVFRVKGAEVRVPAGDVALWFRLVRVKIAMSICNLDINEWAFKIIVSHLRSGESEFVAIDHALSSEGI